MADDALVLSERVGEAIVLLTLNRPLKKNALSIALRDQMSDHLAELAGTPWLKVVIVAGAGSAFSAGFDLGEFGAAANDEAAGRRLWESSDRYHRAFLDFPLPMIAAVRGVAMGGGFDTAVMCDLRIAGHDAKFGHPEVAFGDVVYCPLHDLVGGAFARDLCLTGRIVDAPEALKIGLVGEVVAPEAVRDRSIALARDIAKAPREVLMRTKAKIIKRCGINFTTTLDL